MEDERYNQKNSAVKRILQGVKKMQANPSDNFMSLSLEDSLAILNKEQDLAKKCKVVENVRLLLKNDEEARILVGANGFGEAFLRFLGSDVQENNAAAQDWSYGSV